MTTARDKPAFSLNRQIRDVELQLSRRRMSLTAHASDLRQILHEKIRSPSALFVAAGVGFSAGYYSMHKKPKAPVADKVSEEVCTTSLLVKIMNLISLAGSVMAMLPKADVEDSPDKGMH